MATEVAGEEVEIFRAPAAALLLHPQKILHGGWLVAAEALRQVVTVDARRDVGDDRPGLPAERRSVQRRKLLVVRS